MEQQEGTYCGITAPWKLWMELGFSVRRCPDKNEIAPSSADDCPKDVDLYMAKREAGAEDWRALAWLRKHLSDQGASAATAAAAERLADAMNRLGDNMISAAHIMRRQAEIALKRSNGVS